MIPMFNGYKGLEVYQISVDVLIGVRLYSFNWVFTHIKNKEPMPHFQIVFEFLRYWGLWFNRNVWNTFTFYSQVGVRKYVECLHF